MRCIRPDAANCRYGNSERITPLLISRSLAYRGAANRFGSSDELFAEVERTAECATRHQAVLPSIPQHFPASFAKTLLASSAEQQLNILPSFPEPGKKTKIHHGLRC